MATVDELLGLNEVVDNTIIVDNDLRTLIIPKTLTNIGVESDDNVLSLHFKLPRRYHDIDLSIFTIHVNYLNAKKGGDAYYAKDPIIGDEYIEFDWLVGRHAVSYKGDVKFNLCLKESVDGLVIREFNTTPTTLPVLEGLETGEAVIQEYSDLLEQWYHDLFGIGDTVEQSIVDKGKEVEQSIIDKGEEIEQSIGEAVGAYVTEHADELKGDKGDAFTYEDFTPEQLEALKGEKGDAFEYEDFTPEQLEALKVKGDKGDAFEYSDFTPEQLEALKGEKGDAFEYSDFTPEQLEALKGDKGDAFEYEDFTEDQLAELKGEKGDAFEYEDFTPEQLAALKGAKGDKGDTGAGFKVLDYYDTVEALEAAVPNPNIGDAYGVGTAEPYDIYIYGETSGWVNNGALQGAKGDKGDAFEYEDFTPEQLAALKTEIVNEVLNALPAAEDATV